MDKPEIVIYDFCDTIVDFQTANAYVNFVVSKMTLSKNWIEYMRLALNKMCIIPLLGRLFKNMYINKAMMLYRLKGCLYDDLDYLAKEYYRIYIKNHLIRPVVERLRSDILKGKTVIIVSGGYDIYLKYFASEFGVKNLICSSFAFDKDRFLGKIRGGECMGPNKVSKLLAYFKINNLAELFGKITVYSDSESDMPLFQICDKRVVVTNSNVIPAWAQGLNAEIMFV